MNRGSCLQVVTTGGYIWMPCLKRPASRGRQGQLHGVGRVDQRSSRGNEGENPGLRAHQADVDEGGLHTPDLFARDVSDLGRRNGFWHNRWCVAIESTDEQIIGNAPGWNSSRLLIPAYGKYGRTPSPGGGLREGFRIAALPAG